MALRCTLILLCCQVLLAARVMPSSRITMMRSRDQSGLDSVSERSTTDACDKVVVVDLSGDIAVSGGTWEFSSWEDVEILEKITQKCNVSYRAQCAENGVKVISSCEGDRTISNFKRFDGVPYRRSEAKSGEKLILKVPTIHGTCDFEMSGVVNYWSTKGIVVHDTTPDAHELALVAWAAASMSHNNDECGPEAMTIREKPGYAANFLRDLAVNTSVRADFDGDTEKQTQHNLLALHYHHRTSIFKQGKNATFRNDKIIEKLSTDLKWIVGANFREMKASSSHGLQALAYYSQALMELPAKESSARKALIFTCSFGGGHKSAAKSVSDALAKAGYETVVMDTTYDEHFAERGNMQAAEWFNDFIIKRQMYGIFNVIDKMNQLMGPLAKPCPSPKCDNDRKQMFRTAVLQHRPDIVVTVYHMELVPVLEVAKELGNLPVLHIATDVDLKMPELFNAKFVPTYPRFRIGVPFALEKSYKTSAPLKKAQTFLSGYPVRAAFLQPFDKDRAMKAKSQFVPDGTKLMVIMTGGGGQDVPWPYKLAEEGIGMPLHIVLIAGGNNEVYDKLKAKMPGEVQFGDEETEFGVRTVMQGSDSSVTVEVATDPENTNKDKPYYVLENRMALLLDMADVVMAKPGGGSTAEIAYRGTPAIFDLSVTLFHWEKFTVEVFEDEGRGLRFTSEDELRDTIIQATRMSRSTKIAEDPKQPGTLLDTSVRVVEAADKLLTETECRGCELFRGAVDSVYNRARSAAKNYWNNRLNALTGAVGNFMGGDAEGDSESDLQNEAE